MGLLQILLIFAVNTPFKTPKFHAALYNYYQRMSEQETMRMLNY